MRDVLIDDIVQIGDFPIPMRYEEVDGRCNVTGLCPFCGKILYAEVLNSKDEISNNLLRITSSTAARLKPHMEEYRCSEAKVTLMMSEVTVQYSFDAIQKICNSLNISLKQKFNPFIQIH